MCRVLVQQVALRLVLVGLLSVARVDGECEKLFDAVLCNPQGNGLAFRQNRVWPLECSASSILVLQNSEKEFRLQPTAAFSDGQFAYLFQETWVYVSSGLDLTTLQGPFAISDVFNGFKGRVSAAFFANNYVYLRKGRHSEFSIYTQRVFTKDKNPVWLFSSREETDLRMSAHPKITHLTSTVTIASEARTFLILIVNQTSYYKLDFEACLRKDGAQIGLNEACLHRRPGDVDALFRCAWFSVATLVALSCAILICLLLVACLLVCCWYRRRGQSGTFRHEKQTCCRSDDNYFGESCVDETGYLDVESETTTIASLYNEDKPSIDLNEGYYGKYGKY